MKLLITIGLSALVGYSSPSDFKKNEENTSKMLVKKEVNNDLKAKFTTDITNYLDAFNKGKWDEVMDMIYPKLFDLITREQMRQTFDQMEDMGMEMKMNFNEVEKLSKVVDHESSKFCRVYYNADLSIKVSGMMLENKDQLNKSFVDIYGEEHVKYDEKNNTFSIKAIKSMVAISGEDSNKWTYIEYNEQQDMLLKQLIPEEVLQQIVN